MSPQNGIAHLDVFRSSAFVPFCVFSRQVQAHLGSSRGRTRHKFLKKLHCGTLMDWLRVKGSFEFSHNVYEGNRIFSIKGLVLHLYGDLFLHLLHLRRHVVIVSLRFENETLRPVVDGPLLSFIYSFQNYTAGLGVVLLFHRLCCGPVMTAILMVPAFIFVLTAITTADIRIT